MTKQQIKTIFLVLIIGILSICSLTACKETQKTTVYKLYSYETYDEVYNIGDKFYGMELEKDFVILTLKNDGSLELKISYGFYEGEKNLVDQYITFTGTYTETDSNINALIPEFSSSTISITKAGNLFSLPLSQHSTVILKK